MLIIHLGLAVVMTAQASKSLGLRQVGMTVRARKPFVFARIDRKCPVVEGRPLPARLVMTGFAGGGKPRSSVIGTGRVVVITEMA